MKQHRDSCVNKPHTTHAPFDSVPSLAVQLYATEMSLLGLPDEIILSIITFIDVDTLFNLRKVHTSQLYHHKTVMPNVLISSISGTVNASQSSSLKALRKTCVASLIWHLVPFHARYESSAGISRQGR